AGGTPPASPACRPRFWIVAGVAAIALLLSLLTFEDAPPADRSAPWDGWAVGRAATGSVAAFWGAAELTTHRFLDPVAVIPLLGGLALIIILWVYEYRGKRTLLTLRPLASTIPLAGIVVAICAAAASVAAIALTGTVLAPHYTPLHLGLLYLPELGGAVITAIVFGAVFSTRYIHYYALVGMAFLAAGILVMRGTVPPTSGLTLAGSALIGIGVGASVTPALFLAGFSLRSASIQRVFAILELLRAVAAFMIAPILLHFAVTLAGQPTPAMGTALWITFGLAVGGALAGVVLYLLGGARPVAPSLSRFLGGGEPGRGAPAVSPCCGGGGAGVGPPAAAGRDPPDTPGRRGEGDHHGRRDTVMTTTEPGPVLFAYDGSDLAGAAIAEAGRQLRAGRDALVLTIWEPFNVGFLPVGGMGFAAAGAGEVRAAAEKTAAHGASLAEAAGFRAQSMAAEAAPTWKGIIDAAD